MNNQKRHVADQIIDHLRVANIFTTSHEGIVFTGVSFGCANEVKNETIRRLIDAGVLKQKGRTRGGYMRGHPARIVTLNDEFRSGLEWRQALAKTPYSAHKRGQKQPSKKRRSKLNLENALAVAREMVALTEKLQNKQNELLGVKERLVVALRENKALKAKMAELEANLQQEEQVSRSNQLELNRLTTILQDSRSKLRAQEIHDHQLVKELHGFSN